MWDEPLWVVIDNASPSIRYAGQWTSREVTPDIKTFLLDGPPFSQSMRAPSGTASILFDFIGSRVQVQGTINNPQSLNVSITCQVDGEDLGMTNAGFDYQYNNWAFCDTYDIPSMKKAHTLNFTVTVPEGNSEPFLFDRLIYIPSNATADLDKAVLSIDDKWLKDADDVEYDRFWTEFGDGSYTDTKGSKVAVNFNGTSFRLFGFWVSGEFPSMKKSMASYSIDNQGGLPFEIPAITVDQFHYQNEPLLTLDNLSPGPHRLEVTYTSESKAGRPLTLDYVVIQNEPVSNPSQSLSQSPPNATSSPSPTPGFNAPVQGQDTSKTGPKQGAKIGIGIGAGIGGLLISLFAIWCLHRRRQTRQASLSSDDGTTQPAMSAYNQEPSVALTSPASHLPSTLSPSTVVPSTTTVSSPSESESVGTPVALMYHEDSGIRLDDELNPRPVNNVNAQVERPPTYRKGH